MPQPINKKKPVQVLLVPKYLLIIGKVLTAISPFIAGRFAAILFLTPFRFKIPEREKEMEKKSTQEVVHVPSINRDIVVYHYGGNSKKKILLIHGWSGTGTQMAIIAKRLVEQGYSIVSFDAPGHGK